MDSAPTFGNLSVGEPDPLVASLEQRVQRLEEAVTALQEKKAAEQPLVKAGPPPIEDVPPSRQNDPPITPVLPRHPWLLIDIISEARTMVRMFFDIHYRMAWYTRVSVIIILVLILISGLFLGWLPLGIGFVLVKIFDLVMAFIAYKILSREARRYRDWRGMA